MADLRFEELSCRVIGCAIEVHRGLGPGLFESSYEQCLAHELTLAGISRSRYRKIFLSSTRGLSSTVGIVLTS